MSSPPWRGTGVRPKALRALGLSEAAQIHIVSQLAPRIMAGEPVSASASKEAWTRIAV
jgi:hypothetical protein